MQNKAAGIDRLFDEGGDLSEDLDFTRARRPNLKPRRVNVDFPEWMVKSLDARAACAMALIRPITDDPDMRDALDAAVATWF